MFPWFNLSHTPPLPKRAIPLDQTDEKVSPLVQWFGLFGSHIGPAEDGSWHGLRR